MWWWSIFKNYYHIAGDYRITLPRPKLRFRRRGGSERLLKAKQFESNMLNNWAAIRITHVPINHAVARRHDSTSSLQTPYLDYRASWNFPLPNLLSFSGKSTNDRPSKKARRAGKSQRYKYPPRLEIQWKKTKVEMRGSRNRNPRPVSISRSSCRVELNPPLSGSRQQTLFKPDNDQLRYF